MTASPTHPRHTAPGLGMVELLLSLSIMALLLTSVAAAFQASLNTVDENQKIAAVTHNARIVLNRMMAEIRQAEAVECNPHKVSIIPPDGDATLIEYQLDGDNNILWYRQTIDGTVYSHRILAPDNGAAIHAFDIFYETGTDHEGLGCVRRVTAELDVSVGDNRFAVTASTNPRRNLIW
ncbi:MAG: PilW family protein [Planctomycetota bacterium]